ncbi:aminotransferase class I/II-fold pyridoxal phosphate-dependent enzyme [Hungatella hathewayi]|uniref:aminotransferase class I/II-fold pyridoxal phosphate-dependent enzyme n=1 Tax=Hungatella hathewayi TaxID=154046 RepID=UPI00210E6866|nr:aminotransferase class I/II-fold pyridoxal phosphate-dependent enzyme [Hungatella hathewayi]MCQ5385739.1 aminotransferase class I/II-fold pyridoxal phosphate-dependent enzyme [Hungatella hathewayi]
MKRKKIFLSSPTMHEEEQKYIKEAFDMNWVAPLGANVDGFEREVASYVGVKHAAALTTGTAAIHLAVKLAGVKSDDIVLCSDLTFAATVNPVSYENGIQVFIDSERDTWNMDPQALEIALKKYGSRVKAVIVANLYGTPARLDEIVGLCNQYGVTLIEDAAESLSATYKGRQTGSFGKYNCISFNGNKIITSSGGGMLLSDEEEATKKARFWSTQSRDDAPWYQHSEIGYNYRMSNVVAGIGRGQLLHLEEHKARKKEIYKRYREGLKDLPVFMNPYLECSEPNFWLSCMVIEKKLVESKKVTPEKLRLALEAENVEARPIWKPMHRQPLFTDCDFISVDGTDVGGDIFTRGLCLPSDIKMTEEEQYYIIDTIKTLFDI